MDRTRRWRAAPTRRSIGDSFAAQRSVVAVFFLAGCGGSVATSANDAAPADATRGDVLDEDRLETADASDVAPLDLPDAGDAGWVDAPPSPLATHWTRTASPGAIFSKRVFCPNGDFFSALGTVVSVAPAGSTSWHPVDERFDGFSALACDHANTVWVAAASALHRSRDRGTTWTSHDLPEPTVASYSIAVTNAGTILVLKEDLLLLRSVDDGATWSSRSLGPAGAPSRFVASERAIFMIGPTELTRSRDEGLTFVPIAAPDAVTSMAACGTEVYAAAAGGVFVSTDDGTTWTATALTGDYSDVSCADGGTAVLAVSAVGDLLALSRDGGKTMHRHVGDHLNGASLDVHDGGTVITYSFSDGHVLRSNDYGESFAPLDEGLSSNATSLAIRRFGASSVSGDVFAAAAPSAWSSDEGNSWTRLFPDDSLGPKFAFGPPGVIFKGSSRSTDFGVTFVDVRPDPAVVFDEVDVTPSGRVLLGSFAGGLFRSSDFGVGWTKVSAWRIEKIASRAGVVVACCNETGKVVRSDDDGVTWRALAVSASDLAIAPDGAVLTTGLDGLSRAGPTDVRLLYGRSAGPFPNAVAVDARAIYLALVDWQAKRPAPRTRIVRSLDDGASWTDLSTGISDRIVNALEIDGAGRPWAATDDGVYRAD